jgi:hypothetical protein
MATAVVPVLARRQIKDTVYARGLFEDSAERSLINAKIF